MLGPLNSRVRDLRPISYDLEWEPKTLRLRLVGVFDERGYRSYSTVEAFLERELVHCNRGRTFFAHAGGAFDVQFILPELVHNPDYTVSASFSGASAVLVRVKRDKQVWTFGDSYFLLKDKLAKVGETLGLPKLECPFDAPLPELTRYNQRDNEIVYEGVQALQRELVDLGGELRPTLASCAMALFRRAYLKRRIPTSSRLNDTLRAAYCASRVEVFRPYALRAEYYDINSSFPYSMTMPMPGAFLGVSKKPPQDPRAIWFAEATVQVRECDLPPLPYKPKDKKAGGRIFFPTGTWTDWFSKIDLDLLEEFGHKVVRIHRVLNFDPFTDLADYVKDIYARRKEEIKKTQANDAHFAIHRSRTGEPFPGAELRSYTYKLLLNSLYGKFGERVTKESVLIHPESTSCPHALKGGGRLHPDPPHPESCMSMVAPGIWRLTEIKHVPHAHVPIAAYVTSNSRALLYRSMAACQIRYYCDTDSVMCGFGERLSTSNDLGELKHEGTVFDARFLCPKVYTYVDEATKKHVLKSKGFRKLNAEDFARLADHQPVAIERMAGVRERLRDADGFGPGWSKVTSKRLHEGSMTKRAPDGPDNTRPWTIKELTERFAA